MKIQKSRLLLAIQLAIVLAAPAYSFAAPDARSRGMKHYKDKQYNLAVYHLKGAIETEPSNAHLHYYLANSLVHMRRHPEAIDEYRQSYELDPFGTVSGFCRQALITYNVAIPIVDSRTATRASKRRAKGPSPVNRSWQSREIAGEKPVEEPDSSEEESAPARELSSHEQHMNNASVMIRRQAEDEKARKKSYVDYLASNVVKSGEAKANRIKADAEEQIKELYEGPVLYDSQGNARFRGVPHWRLSPMLQEALSQRAEQIRREASERAELETSTAHERSSQYKKWYMEREEDLDSVADSLETQLHKFGRRAGVALSPFGTGLYVRNYQSYTPKLSTPEPHSSVVRILDRSYDDSPGSSSNHVPQTFKTRTVTGKVLDSEQQ